MSKATKRTTRPRGFAPWKPDADTLVRARRAGLIGWDDIRDDGFTRRESTSWDDPADSGQAVLRSASGYRLDRQRGQERKLVLWCEAAGMVPQLERVGRDVLAAVLEVEREERSGLVKQVSSLLEAIS